MSKIALSPNASGSGTVTITAPNTNTNRTIALPDESGTLLSSGSALPAIDGSALTGVGKVSVISSSDTGASNVANLEIDLPTDSKYRYFQLVITGAWGGGGDPYMRFRKSGDSTFDSSSNAYNWIINSVHHGTNSSAKRSSNGDNYARLAWYTMGNAATETSTWMFEFFATNTNKRSYAYFRRYGVDTSNDQTADMGGFRHNGHEGVVDRLRFYQASGNIYYDTYTLYGIEKD